MKKFKNEIVYLGTQNEIKNDTGGIPQIIFIYDQTEFYLEPMLAENLPENTAVATFHQKIYLIYNNM